MSSASAGARGPEVRSDCWVEVTESAGAPVIELRSKVEALYGDAIRALVHETLAALGASDLCLTMEDSGALPYVQMARIEAAVRRLRPTTQIALPPKRHVDHATTAPSHLRRSRLYLPGNTPKFAINAGLHGPDAIILDLEDAVAPGEKDAARIVVRNTLRAVAFYGAEKMVRINVLLLGLDDVRATAAHGVDTYLLPKAETVADIMAIAQLLDEMAQTCDDVETVERLKRIRLIPIIESARGVLNAVALATASPRVVALAIGLEDYTTDIGAQRTSDGRESLWARAQIINAARAAGIQPLGSVYSEVEDVDGFRAWAREARTLGFEGVGCLHPRQIRAAHAAFAPSADELAKAQRLITAFEQAGQGVVAVDGKMVDTPIVARARKTISAQVKP